MAVVACVGDSLWKTNKNIIDAELVGGQALHYSANTLVNVHPKPHDTKLTGQPAAVVALLGPGADTLYADATS